MTECESDKDFPVRPRQINYENTKCIKKPFITIFFFLIFLTYKIIPFNLGQSDDFHKMQLKTATKLFLPG
jgi:hypothetical protein